MQQAAPEIRSIVVAAYFAGTATRKQLADIFGYHVETLSRWIRCSREGRLVPLPRGHRVSVFNADELKQLLLLLKVIQMLCLLKYVLILRNRVLWPQFIKSLKKLAMSSKKTLEASEQEREGIVTGREEWGKFQAALMQTG